nr:AAA family ATPase [Corynebacterium sp. Marseille-P4611]
MSISARKEDPLLILGSNGSGKSALLLWLHANGGNSSIVRVVGHRRVWLKTSSPLVDPNTASLRQLNEKHRTEPKTRISTDFEDEKISETLTKVLNDFHDKNNQAASEARSSEKLDGKISESYFQKLSKIFSKAGLDLHLDWHSSIGIFVSRDTEGENVKIPITELSDGEKSALLLGAEIITQAPGTVFLIDEPERHLHRSITSKLVLGLINARPDCAFIVSSHDEGLAKDFLSLGYTLWSSTCVQWDKATPARWALNKVGRDKNEPMPESILTAILGGRQKIIFVEGQPNSLDKKLYEALYPGFDVIPAGSCRDVISATKGIAVSKSNHWLFAMAILDRDSRSEAQVRKLESEKIQILSVEEIESVVYGKDAVYTIARILEDNFNSPVTRSIQKVENRLKQIFTTNSSLSKLAETTAEKRLHHSALDHLASLTLSDADSGEVKFVLPSPYGETLKGINCLVAKHAWWQIIENYPVRDIGVPKQICDTLEISMQNYLGALLNEIHNNSDFRRKILETAGLKSSDSLQLHEK